MKYIITILLACVATIGFSQVEHKARFDNPNGNNILEIVNKNTSFNIIGYDGNEVIIQKFAIGNEDAKRQKGLMAVYPGGFKDNTGIGFSVKQEGSKISVRQLSKRPIKLTVKVPRETKIYISEYSASASNFLDYKVSEIAGEIQIKSNYGDINFDNINGPIVLETRHGSIEGTFNRLSSQGPSSLNSSYGIIDVSLNKDAKVDVILAPRSGQAFTDFDIVHDDSVVEDEKETGL
ncbi:MAG: hypothetical protein ACPG5P_03600, partial [Saprospiraceae bacterium]